MMRIDLSGLPTCPNHFIQFHILSRINFTKKEVDSYTLIAKIIWIQSLNIFINVWAKSLGCQNLQLPHSQVLCISPADSANLYFWDCNLFSVFQGMYAWQHFKLNILTVYIEYLEEEKNLSLHITPCTSEDQSVKVLYIYKINNELTYLNKQTLCSGEVKILKLMTQ